MIPATIPKIVEQVRRLEEASLQAPQVPIPTHHLFHARMYHRTIMVPAGVVLTGALVKIPTVVTISGDVSVTIGETVRRIRGYQVLPAAAGRKQAYLAHADTWITMTFPTAAATIEEAEREFTDEADRLISRHGENVIENGGAT